MKKTNSPFEKFILTAIFLLFSASTAMAAKGLALSAPEKHWIGEEIFRNECSSKGECLIWWNEGEDFLSLGIGHFIWYPAKRSGPFEESFPKLVKFFKAKGILLPEWLAANPDPRCLWRTREEFLNDANNPKLEDLRNILSATKAEQTEFIIQRLEDSLFLIRKSSPRSSWKTLTEKFYQLASVPAGVYALADYINFKGLGIFPTENYRGKGWGLAQVLGEMTLAADGPQAVREFVRAADQVLTERVANSPPERNEQKWLAGWRRRLQSYIAALDDAYRGQEQNAVMSESRGPQN